MLQARPVTSSDNIDSDFEFFHEANAGLAAEFDSLSKANIGSVICVCNNIASSHVAGCDDAEDFQIDSSEVLGGSPSTIIQSIFPTMFLHDRREAEKAGADYGRHPCSRFEMFCFNHSQCFFTTASVSSYRVRIEDLNDEMTRLLFQKLRVFQSFGDFSGDDIMSKGFAISIAGRLIDDDIVIRCNNNKSKYRCSVRRGTCFHPN